MPSQCNCCDAIRVDMFREEVDDVVYEVNCAMISVKKGADVDIGIPETVIA